MSENVILKNDDMYGFYDDLYKSLKNNFIKAIENDDFSVISPDWLELIEELKKYEEYEGILKISENNGMGWSVEKYNGENN